MALLTAFFLINALIVPSNVAETIGLYPDSPSPDHVYDQIDILDQWYRYLDTPGHRNAEAHILSEFDDLGLNATVQEDTAQRLDGVVRAANVLGLLEGADPTRCLVIGGHYDCSHRSSKGAYDNAVGVGTVIELARLFSQTRAEVPPISILFSAWDSEEGGGAGSRHFLENPIWDVDIVGYINLDMYSLSYPVKNGIPGSNEEYYKLHVYTSPLSDFRAYNGVEFEEATLDNFTAFRDRVENVTYDQMGLPSQWVIVQDDTAGISDHRFFVERSIPAVWLRGMNEKPREEGDLNEICFKHTPADTLEMMERYAGGKAELLRGIDTGLKIAFEVAIQWMEEVNTTSPGDIDEVPLGDEGGVGTASVSAVWMSVLVLIIVPVVFIVWRRRAASRVAV